MSDNNPPTDEALNKPGEEQLSPEAKAAHEKARAYRLASRIAQAKRSQRDPSGVYILYDPIADDLQVARLIKAAEKLVLADPFFGGKPCLGMCHVIWATQQEILENEHGIEWFSPAEMNPNTSFD